MKTNKPSKCPICNKGTIDLDHKGDVVCSNEECEFNDE